MVPYYDHHSAKMFIGVKRFGFKLWMMCSSSFYPYAMRIYSVKFSGKENCPFGSRVVWDLLSSVENPEKYAIFFDKFFWSYKLFTACLKRVSKLLTRVGNLDALPNHQTMFENGKDEILSAEVTTKFSFSQKDSAVVTIVFNYSTHENISKTERFRRAQKKENCFSDMSDKYNDGMGVVDILHRLLGSHRLMFRNKKWCWNLFRNALNMAPSSGWILHLHLQKGATAEVLHHNFRREVNLCLLRLKRNVHSISRPFAHCSESLR